MVIFNRTEKLTVRFGEQRCTRTEHLQNTFQRLRPMPTSYMALGGKEDKKIIILLAYHSRRIKEDDVNPTFM